MLTTRNYVPRKRMTCKEYSLKMRKKTMKMAAKMEKFFVEQNINDDVMTILELHQNER